MRQRSHNRIFRSRFAPALLLATVCVGCDAEPEDPNSSERGGVYNPYTQDITLASMDYPDAVDSTTQFNVVTRDPWFDVERCEGPYLRYSTSGGTAEVPLSRTTRRTLTCNKLTEFWFEVPNTPQTYADFGLPAASFNSSERLSVRIGAQNMVECSNKIIYYSATVYASSNPNGYGWPSRYLGAWQGDFLSVELENCDMKEYADIGPVEVEPG